MDPKYHIAEIRLKDIFSKKSFEIFRGGTFALPGAGEIEIPADITVIGAKIKGRERAQDELLVESLIFPAEIYTTETATAYLENNNIDILKFNNALKSKVMEKELLLYTSIYGNTASMLIEKMAEIPKDEDFTIRLNCPGGSVFAGWGIIAKMKEHEGKIKIKVDGHAASFGAFMLLYADTVECIEPAQFMLHRAAGYVENEDDQKLLDSVNADLQKALQQRIKPDKFKELTNLTIKDLFTGEKRRDIWLNAKEAKAVGLVSKITRIKPTEIDQLNNKMVAFADFSADPEDKTHVSVDLDPEDKTHVSDPAEQNSINKNLEKMTKDEFKLAHPAVYSEIITAATAEGVKTENVRVKSLLAFLKYDPENVLKMIKENTEFTTDVQAEFLAKMTAKVEAVNLEDDNAEDQKPGDAKDPETLKKEAIEAETKKVLENI